MGGNDGGGRLRHVAPRQVVRFQITRLHAHAGLHQRDLLPHDHRVIDVPQLHADQVEDADLRPGRQTLDVEPLEAEELNEHEQEDEQGEPECASEVTS